jgi:predicted RNase H-like HicB family nuclease
MLRVLTYPLAVERHDEDGGYLAYFPSLPGCQTWGETYEAAVHNAEEALAVYIETLTANGDPIPEPNIIEGPVSLGVMVRADIAALWKRAASSFSDRRAVMRLFAIPRQNARRLRLSIAAM